MRITIYFVRHAEAVSNINPLDRNEPDMLTGIGLQQARSLALRLKDISIENIYTSKVHRAQQTAQEIGKIVGKEPMVLDFLKERKGSYTNLTEYSHIETFKDLKIRLVEAKTFLENLPNKNIVVVSHAIFLKALASYIMLGDLVTEELLTSISHSLTLDHAALSKCMYNSEKQQWHIESWNDKAHLNVTR